MKTEFPNRVILNCPQNTQARTRQLLPLTQVGGAGCPLSPSYLEEALSEGRAGLSCAKAVILCGAWQGGRRRPGGLITDLNNLLAGLSLEDQKTLLIHCSYLYILYLLCGKQWQSSYKLSLYWT